MRSGRGAVVLNKAASCSHWHQRTRAARSSHAHLVILFSMQPAAALDQAS